MGHDLISKQVVSEAEYNNKDQSRPTMIPEKWIPTIMVAGVVYMAYPR